MKNPLSLLFASFIILLFISIQVKSVTPGDKKKSSSTSKALPDSIHAILKHSCFACHTNGGNVMAESKVNFDKWNNYKEKKQLKKAEDICRMVSKGAMPPKKAREAKPEIIPTAAQVKSICNWAKSLQKK